MESLKTLALIALMLVALPAQTAGTNGQYWHGGVSGGVTCPDFVDSLEASRKHGKGSVGWARELSPFANFVAGYQTAFNRQTTDTCDIFGGIELDQALAWVGNYCRANPLTKFSNAVDALATERFPHRRRLCP